MNASELLNSISEKKIEQQKFLVWLIDNNRTENVLNMTFCGSWLVFKDYINTGTATLQKANFCKKFLLCPCCAIRRSSRFIHKYKEKVDQVMIENPTLIPVMITLTLKNGEDLKERMTKLEKSFSSMKECCRKAKSKSSRNAPIEFSKVQGSLAAYEVTHEESGWHPHLHIFALLSDYIDVEELSAEWRHFTGDSFIVDVRKCKNANTGDALVEVLKYSSKFSSMSFEQRLQVHDDIAGKRWVNPSGLLRGVLCGSVDEPDYVEEDGPFRFMVARWLLKSKSWNVEMIDTNDVFPSADQRSAPLMVANC